MKLKLQGCHVDLTGMVSFLSLNRPVSEWVDTILKYKDVKERTEQIELIRAHGYDVSSSYQIIENLYNQEYKGNNNNGN